MTKLSVGPFLGEFGYELFEWQPVIRSMSRAYDTTEIICRKGNEYLYADFVSSFHTVECEYKCNGLEYNGATVNTSAILRDLKSDVHFLSPFNEQLADLRNSPREFHRYDAVAKEQFDILIHARAVDYDLGEKIYRNWPKDRWEELVGRLHCDIACIGVPSQSLHIEGTTDMRGVSLEHLCGLMNGSRVVAGPSSGPMHLASLCGAKHVVWSNASNRNRYQTIWNPFDSPVVFYDAESWQPQVDSIVKLVRDNI